MTEFSSPRDELIVSLRSYTSLLSARNDALSRLSATSAEIRSTLRSAEHPDVSEALLRRDRDLADLSAISGGEQDESVIEAAISAANSANDELGEIARSVIALREDSRALADEVLACQSECEALLRARLESTARAIQHSSRRRRLDAAYGPAVSVETPTFMDRQR